ncbi:transcription factor bHLH123-like [Typha latifolia]|uniref:transcription factor bHLH123-like n=1 Tax=Typha latifolia TaxID=4733 RepID=UPI003C2B59CC
MEEMIQSEMSSSWGWWNNMRSAETFGGPGMSSEPPSCSTELAAGVVNGCPNWSLIDSPGSVLNSSIALHDTHQSQFSYQMIDWSENILSNSGRIETSLLPTLFQEDYLESNEKYMISSRKLLNEMNQEFSYELPVKQSLQYDCKSISGGIGDLCSRITEKTDGDQPAFKKPRIATPSSLPTFKVRKEKLGDRITALQQLVSPFGKTDTASVLQEAIEYIKFLHDQVGILSAPHLKNGHQLQHLENLEKSKEREGPKQDLGSRGLCLVPISSTFDVPNEVAVDFWTPTFGLDFS